MTQFTRQEEDKDPNAQKQKPNNPTEKGVSGSPQEASSPHRVCKPSADRCDYGGAQSERRDSATKHRELAATITSSPSAKVGSQVIMRECTCTDHRPLMYCETVHFHELDHFRDKNYRLGFFQHEALLLAELAISTFDGQHPFGEKKKAIFGKPSGFLLSPVQHRAMQAFKDWCKQSKVHARKYRWCSDSVFEGTVEAFNQLFFLGQLPNRMGCDQDLMSFKIERRSPPGMKRRGVTSTVVQGTERQWVETTMWMDPFHPAHRCDRKKLLNTLLHEMCHAFLQRHSCYAGGGEGCDSNQVCVALCEHNYGTTGHGRAWQMLAAGVEEAAGRLLGDVIGEWKPDLGRLEAAAKEIMAMGGEQVLQGRKKSDSNQYATLQSGWWPSKCDLEVFGGEDWWRLKPLMQSRDDTYYHISNKVRSWALSEQNCGL